MKMMYKRIKNLLLKRLKNTCEKYNQINNTIVDYEQQLDYLIISNAESLKEIRKFIDKLKRRLWGIPTDEKILVSVAGLVGFLFI